MTAPTTQTTSLDDALDHVMAEPVIWVRVAAVRHDDRTWRERLLELTSGERPPSWEGREWEYPSTLFAAITQSGQAVADWLRAGRITLGDRAISIPQMMDRVTWERRQSRSPAPYETLDWPVTEASFSQTNPMSPEPHGHLLAAGDAPSFVNFYAASASFFWRDRQPVGGSVNQGVMYRHQDTRGRINRVRITDDDVEVEVEGNALDGMIVELSGDAPGPRQSIRNRDRTRSDMVRFSLKDGLPPGGWVLLRRGAEWIDRRFLAVPWAQGSDAGVEVVVEPGTKLEAFLTNREGPQAEFKRQVPTDDDGKAKTMKTVCAFANGAGGSVLFGIDDDHHLVGIAAQRIDRLKDQLTQISESWVEPRPPVDFDTMPIADGETVVLELRVPPGTALYGCARPGEVPVTYIRHHARSVRARPAEIEAIVRSRNPANPRPPWS